MVVEEDCVDDERCQELASGHHFDFSLLLVACSWFTYARYDVLYDVWLVVVELLLLCVM